MDKTNDKDDVNVIDTDARYSQLSFQLFGETSSESFQGPFVDLSLKQSAVNDLMTPEVTPSTVLPSERCLICYSQLSSLETSKNWDDFYEFLQILHEPVSSHNGNRSLFNLTVKQFKERRTTWCLCVNCDTAFGKLVEVHRQMKKLEEEVKVFQDKFLNAIKLSKAITENKPGQLIVTETSLDTLEQVRTCLIGGSETWEGIKEKWMEFVNIEKITDVTVKIENELNVESVENEINSWDDEAKAEDNSWVDPLNDNSELLEVLSEETAIKIESVENEMNDDDDDDNDKISTPTSNTDIDPKPITKKRYKKGKFKLDPNKKYAMTPGAVRYRELRAQYPHLTAEQMKAHLRTLPKKSRKGKPSPFLAVEDLKQSKTNAWYINWRKTYGKTMSVRAYTAMKRKELLETQKINNEEIGAVPGRSNIGKGGVKIKWEDKGPDKMMYCGVEIRKNEDGTFSCLSCENGGGGNSVKPVKTKGSMSRHIKKQHIELTNGHACDQCDAKFFYHSQLTAHIQGKHEGFQCEICGQGYQYWTSLNVHKKTKHQDIKPHVCEHCGKRFAERRSLTIHLRTHSGERPFVCHVCSNTYIDKSTMKKHIKKFHPDDEEEPVIQPVEPDNTT